MTAPAAVDDYTTALRRTLERPDDADRDAAYVFGRTALNERLGLIDLVLRHHAALAAALPPDAAGSRREELLNAAGEFLAEGLSPFEMAYRSFLETNEALVGVNHALEREAKRVARLLHDGAGQFLFTLQLALAELDRELPPHLTPVLDEIRNLTSQLDEQLHLHSRELYPVVLEDLGLAAALEQLLAGLDRGSDLKVVFDCTLDTRLPADVEFSVYRAVQEAITNIVKHARATQVTVRLHRGPRRLWCSVADNGVGGAAAPGPGARKGLGLLSIRERMKLVAGTVELRSPEGEGTEIVVTAPLPDDSRRRNGEVL